MQTEHKRQLDVLVNTNKDDDFHVKELEKETEAARLEVLERIQKEYHETLAEEKQRILTQYTKGAENDAELQNDIRKLLSQDFTDVDSVIQGANQEKQTQESKIKQRTAGDIGEHEKQMIADKEKFNKALEE